MSRAEYYRQYRKRSKNSVEQSSDVTLADVAQLLQNVAQQVQQTNELLRNMLQIVAQQNATVVAKLDEVLSAVNYKDLGQVSESDVAQQSQQIVAQPVAQQSGAKTKVKRKGILPPFSPLLSPPHTPPYSSPLISPHLPKEKSLRGAEIFSSEQTSDVAQQSTAISPDTQAQVGSGLPSQTEQGTSPDRPDESADNPMAPLVDPGRTRGRDLATWAELDEATKLIFDETRSMRLVDAFYNWIEYKQERGPKEFYTKRGMVSEARRFIKRHLDEFDVASAVERAIASSWQGWDHDQKK